MAEQFLSQEAPEYYPDVMTEVDLIRYLRIPKISKAKNYHNVIENLKRFRGLPRVHICNKDLFLKPAILEWLKNNTLPKK